MSALRFIRILLGFGALTIGTIGFIIAFNIENIKGIALLILSGILLFIMLHAWDIYLILFFAR